MRSNSKTIKRSVSPYGPKVFFLLISLGKHFWQEKTGHELPVRKSHQGL